tara:strand:- start:6613 stop:8037 length:1425 start_codon:yes stop_codon:yes gene_type:complete
MYDVIVIGGGPAGYVAAIRASQLGLNTVCIEKYTDDRKNPIFGGTCLNSGCIPSKALLDSSQKFYDASKSYKSHGIGIENIMIDLSVMMDRKNSIVKKLTSGIDSLLKANKVNIISGSGKVLAGSKVQLTTLDNSIEILESKNIIIATGSSPIEIKAANFDDKNIVDSTGALEFDEIPKKLGVIGAGVIGLELGSVWARLGSKVTIIEAMDDFLSMTDRDIARASLKEFQKQGLDIKLGSRVISSQYGKEKIKVIYEDKKNKSEIEFDKLIVAVGRSPNTKNIFSEDSGVELDSNGFIFVDDYCQTNASNVWAIGDVVRGPMLAHKGSEEGIMVAERIASKDTKLNYDLVPSVIYTHPEIAWVGKNESELKAENIDYKIGSFPFAASGRALAADESVGFVKLLSDKNDDGLLGAHVFGASAAEILQQALISMEFDSSAEDLSLIMFSHPTVSEALHEAALSIHDHAIHLVNKRK